MLNHRGKLELSHLFSFIIFVADAQISFTLFFHSNFRERLNIF